MPSDIRVLILEDNQDDAHMLVRALGKFGYQPHWQCVATEAAYLDSLQHDYDVILADYRLPQFTALKALQLMQERGLDIPFIVVTGAVSEEVAVECMKQGAEDYLLKDRLTRLGPAVRQALREKDLRDAKQQAEAALRDSEARFRAIAEATPIPMAIFHIADSTLVYANAPFEATFGVSMQQICGRRMADFCADPADYHRLVASLPDDGYLCNYEVQMKNLHGAPFWTMASCRTLTFNGLPCLLGGFYDISTRKQAEEALTQHSQALARANAEIEQFLYIASHDLQEPLRKIISFVQLLAQRYENKFDADANLFIHYAVEGAYRLRSMIQGLLAYTRITTRGRAFVPTQVDGLLQDVLRTLEAPIAACGADLTYEAMPLVSADSEQLLQVFQQLIDNALKFRCDLTPHIHVGVKQTDKDWVFSVQDNGIGIDAQYAERIFIAFQRLHGMADYPGPGIGLALCKKIIERHGGHIWVESQKGHGATFFFTLPLSSDLSTRQD